MNHASRLAVRLAARALPRGARNRYREEWMGDLESAQQVGVRESDIAMGALVFSARLNRDAPEISGVPITVATRRHARWGIALLSASALIAAGFWVNGGFASAGSTPGFAGVILTPINTITPIVAITVTVIGLGFLWRAALLASGLAKISAALASMMAVLLFVPLPNGASFLLAAVLGVGAGMCGLLAWAGAPYPVAPRDSAGGQEHPASSTQTVVRSYELAPLRDDARPTSIDERRLGAIPITVIITFVVLGVAAALSLSGPTMLIVGASAAVAVIATIVIAVTRSRRRSWAGGVRPSVSNRARITVGASSLLMLGMITFGSIEMLVWSPQVMAPGYTITEIYAALSELDRAGGIGAIVFWIALSTLATGIYLVAGLILAGRPGHFSPGTFALIGFTVIAAMVFFQFWAGFSIGNSISDTLPPYVGGRSELGYLYGVLGQAASIGAVIGLISPPPLAFRPHAGIAPA